MLFVVATQENRQADYTCRTENNLPGNQQDAYFSPRPVPFWSHSEGWWGYYPVPYNAPSNKPANEADERSLPYPRHPDENACVGYKFFYPVYDENFANVARIKLVDRDHFSDPYGYVAVICPQPGHNDVQSDVDTNNYVHNHYVHSSPAQNDRYFMQYGSVNESRNTLPNEINHLDAQSSGTCNPRNVCESDKSCLVTAMNIVDEEDDASDRPDETVVSNDIEKSKKTFGLHINVPNYTYIDTSDSSDSSECSDSNDSDSSDSVSDNEHLSDSCQKYCNDTTSNNTLSNSDSDSYEGYSVDLNSYEKPKTNPRASSGKGCAESTAHSDCSINVDNSCKHLQNNSENGSDEIPSKKSHNDYSNDRNSCVTLRQDLAMCLAPKGCNEMDYTNSQGNLDSCSSKTNSIDTTISNNTEQRDQEDSIAENIIPHQLGIIYEDERSSCDNLHYENKMKIDGQNESSFEVTDDPPDDTEATMVSVSLPLKFRFSVSEDNEDITTVTVGNSEIKAEKSRGGYSVKNEEDDDVCVNFHIGNDTSVDFTVRRHTSDNTTAGSTRDEVSVETAVPHVDFTFKKEPMSIDGTNGKRQNTENTEFPLTKTTGRHRMNFKESASKNAESVKDADSITDSESATEDVSVNGENCIQVESACNSFGHGDVNGTAAESQLVTSERSWIQNSETPQVPVVDINETNQSNCGIIVNSNDDRCVDPEFYQTDPKYLLNVQDSREDTDDEDSGVTSDISRMISEVDAECREIDTDSECTAARNPKKYQRTQTHSRLFRLLNDDSNLSDCTSGADPGTRKEYLSLPLKTNAFSYDDSYCSNYSSGLTSPEYSPVHEQSCRKFHDATTSGNPASLTDLKLHRPAEQIPSRDNSQSWKNTKLPNVHEHDVIPSLAFKILNSRIPPWAYKVNVLCPRIKSTKSVPQALLARQIDEN